MVQSSIVRLTGKYSRAIKALVRGIVGFDVKQDQQQVGHSAKFVFPSLQNAFLNSLYFSNRCGSLTNITRYSGTISKRYF